MNEVSTNTHYQRVVRMKFIIRRKATSFQNGCIIGHSQSNELEVLLLHSVTNIHCGMVNVLSFATLVDF